MSGISSQTNKAVFKLNFTKMSYSTVQYVIAWA